MPNVSVMTSSNSGNNIIAIMLVVVSIMRVRVGLVGLRGASNSMLRDSQP